MKKINIKDSAEVLDLVKELKHKGEASALRYRMLAERNERYYHALQHQESLRVSEDIYEATIKAENAKCYNLVRGAVDTLTTRVLKDRPSITAFPASADPSDAAAAEIAKKFIEYFEKLVQFDQLLDDTVKMAWKHGTAGMKVCYDPEEDNVLVRPVSIFNYLVDPRERVEDQRWCIFLDYLEPEDAMVLLEGAGIYDEPKVERYRENISEEREGVLVLEVWHVPSPRVPVGLYCKVIGDHVIDVRPYPYIFGPLHNPEDGKKKPVLPLVTCRIDHVRGGPFGDTPVTEGVALQRRINSTEQAIANSIDRTQHLKLVVASDDIKRQMKSKDQVIVWSGLGNQQGQPGWYLPAPALPSAYFQQRQELRNQFYEAVGLNQLLAGAESVKSGTSGTTIAYLNELDSMKTAGASKSIETMIVHLWHLILGLVQTYFLRERVMRITDDSGVRTEVFYGANLRGIDIDLEPRRGDARFHATKVAEAQQELQAQLIPAEQYMEMKVTGQDMTGVERSQRRAFQEHLKGILMGGAPALLDGVDPAMAIDEIQKTKDMLSSIQPRRLDLQDLLSQMLAAYEQQIQMQAAQTAEQVQ